MTVEIFRNKLAACDESAAHISIPPDKSIFHRIVIIGSLTKSVITIPVKFETIPADVLSSINAMRTLGVRIDIEPNTVIIHGVGLNGLLPPQTPIDCGNSGTTARLLMGLLAGQKFASVLTGDASLSRRPMKRLADVLTASLGAIIHLDRDGVPVRITGRTLHSGQISLPVASAQMSSAIRLASLFAETSVTVSMPSGARDHTERIFSRFGERLQNSPKELIYRIPGDFSSASFFFVAAILLKRKLRFNAIGLNPTRTHFLEVLKDCGLIVRHNSKNTEYGEPFGDIEIDGTSEIRLDGYGFTGEDIRMMIDEIPALAVLAAFHGGSVLIDNAGELRKKETDRISAIIKNLSAFGADVKESGEGFTIRGMNDWSPIGGKVDHFGDHRIAMAFAILGLRASTSVTISEANVVSISYPHFFTELQRAAGSECVTIRP